MQLVLIIALIIGIADANTLSVCPNGWIAYEGSCYLFGHEDIPMTFTAAEQYCRQHGGGHLIHVENVQENAFIKDQLRERKHFQPDDHDTLDQDCLIFTSVYDFRWADVQCSYKFPPICEIRSEHIEPGVVG
ncbi:snaclec echicetin subunit alpha-like isoform X3 [Dreissena polymorpha]|uniref:snaclec echicetin subunit alpha-like isoform X3 n=1 Tax=Dreissena polymorpha TaxID=45954 RepID=UPI002264370A|nr:snaclec echicetin subunit alpha-like isoform X3 [Dreissena polymorpha]